MRDALVRKGVEEDVERAGGVEVEVTCTLSPSSAICLHSSKLENGEREGEEETAPMRFLTLSFTAFARFNRSSALSVALASTLEWGGPMFERSSTMSFEYPSDSSRRRLNFCCL